MARNFCIWAAFMAALFLLSACSLLSDSTPLLSAPLPAATMTPYSIAVPPTSIPLPTQTPTPDHPIFRGPLTVKIIEPADNAVINQSPVELIGLADPGTVITINDDVILVDTSKTFKVSVSLEPGDNLIEITASDADNAQGFAYLDVIYEPQP